MADVEEPKQTTDEEIEEKVVNKLRKITTVKKVLSEKQQQHLKKLSEQRAGKRYQLKTKVEEVPVEEVELPEEVAVKKPRRKKEPVIVYESESESEPEQIIVRKKRTKAVKQEVVEQPVVPKKRAPRKKPVPKSLEEPQAQPAKQVSSFNFRIC